MERESESNVDRVKPEVGKQYSELDSVVGNDGGDVEQSGGTSEPLDPSAGVTAKPKRGRSKGSVNAGTGGTVSAASPTSGTSDTGKRKAKKALALDPDSLTQQLCGLHEIAALLLKNPAAKITPLEGRMLAVGIIGVAEQYSMVISPVVAAWLQLAGACAMVYGPKLMIARSRPKPAVAPGTVPPIQGAPIDFSAANPQ